MATIHLHQTTSLTPEQYVAGLTDFGPGRSKLFGNSADEYLKVALPSLPQTALRFLDSEAEHSPDKHSGSFLCGGAIGQCWWRNAGIAHVHEFVQCIEPEWRA